MPSGQSGLRFMTNHFLEFNKLTISKSVCVSYHCVYFFISALESIG